MEISFGVITYNSEDTIIEALESIRFQVEQFGRMHKNYLVISDDCSSDNTHQLLNAWIDKYKEIFSAVTVVQTEKNSGLCVNYAQLMKNIHTNIFIKLSGDDLISSENVYDKVSMIETNELRVHLTLEFTGSKVWNKSESMVRQLYYSGYRHTNKRDIVLLETMSPYASVEIAFLKHHYTDACMEYIKNYRNFEDDTSLYYVLKNDRNVKFQFVMTPLILYRRESKSLTKMVDTSSQISFLDDLYRFSKEKFKNEKNILVKIFLGFIVWDNFLMKHRFDASKCIDRKIVKLIEKKQYNRVERKCPLGDYLEIYKAITEREDKYLKMMHENAVNFINGL